MTPRAIDAPVRMAFERTSLRLAISDIQPLRFVNAAARRSSKFAQIAASVREVGIIEPPVVARDATDAGKFLLLDGHLRIEVLKDLGETEVVCLVATDDEAFTYNKRVSRIAIIQEHKMILKAIERGVPEERLAKALNVDVPSIRRKRRLLDGICPETADLLKDKHVPINVFSELRKMKPLRQIEAAQLMNAMNKYTIAYAKSLVAATSPADLVETQRPKRIGGLSPEQLALMEKESVALDREVKLIELSYSADHLDLVLAVGFLGRLLGSAKAVRYLAQHHPDLLAEFQRLTEAEAVAA